MGVFSLKGLTLQPRPSRMAGRTPYIVTACFASKTTKREATSCAQRPAPCALNLDSLTHRLARSDPPNYTHFIQV